MKKENQQFDDWEKRIVHERPEPIDNPPDSRPVMHMEIEFNTVSVKRGDIVGKVHYENSEGLNKWCKVVYEGNNMLKLVPETKDKKNIGR